MNRNRAALLLILLVLSTRGYAQGDDSDDDDSDGPASPELSLHFDKQGSVAERLDLVKKTDNGDTIRNGLGSSLHCPQQRFHSPSINVSNSQTLNRLPVAARETYLHALADYNSRQLMANCDAVLRWNGRGREGNIDLTPLANALKMAGAPQLWVFIYFLYAGRDAIERDNVDLLV